MRYVKKEFNLMIGERTAEELKVAVGNVYPKNEDAKSMSMDVRGRSLISGLPQNIQITAEQTREALQETVDQIVFVIYNVLEKTPPELASDISEKGIIMTGGGSLLKGLDKLLSERTGIPVTVAENAVSAVAEGAGKAIENLDMLSPNSLFRK